MTQVRSEGFSAPGLIVAAPSSGSGKTLFTQALLRLLKNTGTNVCSAKTGPDYIDPRFHSQASGRPCLNLDSWAMRPSVISHLVDQMSASADLIVCEGVMGLFDGADVDDDYADGSTASLARLTGWPIVLVVDASKQAASVAALVSGFVNHAPDVKIDGIVFNRVGSPAHEMILRKACATHLPDVKILGALPRQADLTLPERHLGLVQAQELDDFDSFLETASIWLADHLDADELVNLTRPAQSCFKQSHTTQIRPFGSRIAIADDIAFGFSYPSLLQSWRDAGAETTFFSPLAGESPQANCEAIYLPGGYPELHAGVLASNGFLDGLRAAANRGTAIFGECGGYMVLGDGLIDSAGSRHKMAGLLPVETSFETPKLHLGYRKVELQSDCPAGSKGQKLRGHEFHYASVVSGKTDQNLFKVANASGSEMGVMGFARGNVAGSFIHLIDQEQA